MTNYKDIQGTAVQNIAGDPDNPVKGQLWYDSTNSEFKFQEQIVGSVWRTGGSLNTARQSSAGSGTQTSSLCYGGSAGPRIANNESYNGTIWTETHDLNSARDNNLGAGASNTSAICFAGETPPGTSDLTESYNGSSWTEVGDLSENHTGGGGFGIQTSAIAVSSNGCESWNGSAWTEVADLNTARANLCGRPFSCTNRKYRRMEWFCLDRSI